MFHFFSDDPEHKILGSAHHLCFMKTATDWKLPPFSASGEGEILAVLCTFPIV